MFQIKYDNVFLNLVPNQDCEIERNSPLFLVDNFFAEYSSPVSLAYSDETANAIGWYFFQPTIRIRKKFPVEVWDKGTYKCNATLALESAGMNTRNKGASTAGGYLLIGISDFLQSIQSKKLTELSLGGDRSFNFTSYDAFDSSDGWWQHFHATWDGTLDYVFATCRNETWTGIDNDPFATGYMNALFPVLDGSVLKNTLKPGEPVVPFVKVKFILESIFNEAGWTVDFSGLNDSEWEKLLLWSVRPLYISQQTYQTNTDTGKLEKITSPLGLIKIHLGDFMPTGYTCAEFIISICVRFGWAPIPSTTTRSCRFVALKEQKNKPAKDWTSFAAAAAATQITVDEKIFSFKNDFEGNDNFPSPPDFTNVSIGNAVQTFEDLPNPASGAYDQVKIYVFKDNQYYEVVTNSDNTARLWDVFADNIYDLEPAADVTATDTFETKCCTLPVYKTLYRTADAVDYYAYLPLCQQSQSEQFGIKVLLYHGIVKETKADGTEGDLTYPFASSTHIRHDAGTNLTWSNVYQHKDTSGNDFGIVKYWWQNWLDVISNVEDAFVKRYFLPLYELLKFQWDDIILDNNIPFLVKKIIEPLPYTGYIECTMQRIALSKIISTGGSTAPQQTVYLRISIENSLTDQEFNTWEEINVYQNNWSNATVADIIVRAYSDEAGTIALSLTGFAFKTISTSYKDGVIDQTSAQTWVMNGTQQNVNPFVFKILEADFKRFWYFHNTEGNHTVTLASWHVLNQMQLVPDSSYVIIP